MDQGWQVAQFSTTRYDSTAIFQVRLLISAAITLRAAFMKIKPPGIWYHVNWQFVINVP